MKICIIPARGGSRRIPGKNIRPFHGKPIIQYSIELALKEQFDFVWVSTDREAIAEVARSAGADIHSRSAEMAQDHVGTQDVARHVLSDKMEILLQHRYSPNFNPWTTRPLVCVLYPTAPLLIHADLEQSKLALMREDPIRTKYIFSVGTKPLSDAGQFYWGWMDAFMERLPLIGIYSRMWPVHESRVCDINTEEDWARAEAMYAASHKEK